MGRMTNDQGRLSSDSTGRISPHARGGSATDDQLVQACIAGTDGAWERMYALCHGPLLRTIQVSLGAQSPSDPLVDEIAARVWFALIRDDFRLLSSFDAARDVRLRSFLAGLARIEILRFFRSERRRILHEGRGGHRSLLLKRATLDFDSMLEDFSATLTASEREVLEADLAPPGEDVGDRLPHVSREAIYQRRHRISIKLREFFRGF